jgi:hypothetical protein
MLDLLEAPLRARGYEYRRLDGTMSVAQRERAVLDFEGRPSVLVLLVSLKAAALGLNLVSANRVVLMDPWWCAAAAPRGVAPLPRGGAALPGQPEALSTQQTLRAQAQALTQGSPPPAPRRNPAVEEQAIDRAHRIGQTRPVTVTRITVPGTVEDRILKLQARLRGLRVLRALGFLADVLEGAFGA